MINEILKKVEEQTTKALEHLRQEFTAIQAGKSSPAMVENLMVNAYGQMMPLKSSASISCPEFNQILISPWDASLISAIEKAIRDSSLGVNPQNDGASIRINLPPMTEEKRKDLVKVIHLKVEEAKISIRQTRQDAKSKIERLEKDKEISEDEMKKGEKDLQDLIDKKNKEVEELGKHKEESILKV